MTHGVPVNRHETKYRRIDRTNAWSLVSICGHSRDTYPKLINDHGRSSAL